MPTALVTGAEGFIGGHLVAELAKKGETVIGTVRPGTPASEHPKGDVTVEPCDVNDTVRVHDLIERYRPEEIFHLAAESLPTKSWEDPWTTLRTNALGTVNVFEGVRHCGSGAIVFVACSSAEYGDASKFTEVLTETSPLLPLHPYGVSKVCQDLLAYQYFRCYGLKCIRGRIFNTIGPRKVHDAPSDFARQVALVEKGRLDAVHVGNLDTTRSYTDVRDMVGAIIASTRLGHPGQVYNLCASRGATTREILSMLTAASTAKVPVVQDPERARPSDEPRIVGDSSRLRAETGWQERVPLPQTLGEILDYWRARALASRTLGRELPRTGPSAPP